MSDTVIRDVKKSMEQIRALAELKKLENIYCLTSHNCQ